MTATLIEEILFEFDTEIECERDDCNLKAEWISQFIPCLHFSLICTPHKAEKEKESEGKFNDPLWHCVECKNNGTFCIIENHIFRRI